MIKKILFSSLFGLLIAPYLISAASIELKNGNTIIADIIERTDEYIKVDFKNLTITYYTDMIEKISPITNNIYTDISLFYLDKAADDILNGNFIGAEEKVNKGLKNSRYNYDLQEISKVMTDLNNKILTEEYVLNLFKGIKAIFDENNTQALTHLKSAQQINSNYPTAYIWLGCAHLFNRQETEAKKNFLKAKEIFQNNENSLGIQEMEIRLQEIP